MTDQPTPQTEAGHPENPYIVGNPQWLAYEEGVAQAHTEALDVDALVPIIREWMERGSETGRIEYADLARAIVERWNRSIVR